MPTSTTHFPFVIDGQAVPIFIGKRHRHWQEAAEAKAFTLISRAVDRLHVVLGCLTCGMATLKRTNVLLEHKPECPHCIRARRKTAARQVGVSLLGPDPEDDRHYGLYQFACGHVGRRQHLRVENAAAGGHRLGCERCLIAQHEKEAKEHGWQLVGASFRRNPSYRRYQHVCGHSQDVSVGNMRVGDVDCSGCGESWSSKPSKLYVMSFNLPEMTVIKLGFSSNPAFRLRQVQADPARTRGTVHREIGVESGHRAICVEKALHAHIKKQQPELIVSPELFEQHIRTTSEIYHLSGLRYITSLLDAVEAGWDPSVEPIVPGGPASISDT